MFDSVHNKLILKSKAYRDWHRSGNSSIVNALIFALFGVYLSAVVWFASMPDFLQKNTEAVVLGVSVQVDDDIVENAFEIISFTVGGQFSPIVVTKENSVVWIEYDNSENGYYMSTPKTNIGMTHVFDSQDIKKEEDFVYRICVRDMNGNTIYSQLYSFNK